MSRWRDIFISFVLCIYGIGMIVSFNDIREIRGRVNDMSWKIPRMERNHNFLEKRLSQLEDYLNWKTI